MMVAGKAATESKSQEQEEKQEEEAEEEQYHDDCSEDGREEGPDRFDAFGVGGFHQRVHGFLKCDFDFSH